MTPLEMLKNLNRLNKCNCASAVFDKYGGNKVPYHTFYVSELLETIDIRIDYVKWVLDNPRVSTRRPKRGHSRRSKSVLG